MPSANANAGRQVPAHREEAAAQRGVAARAVRHRGAGIGQAFQFAFRRMHVVREHRTRPGQAEAVVCREVVLRPGKGAQHVRDLLRVLVQMGLKADVRILAHQRLADLEHGFRRREREARRHRVAQAIAPVEALDQRPALLVSARRRCCAAAPAAGGRTAPAR